MSTSILAAGFDDPVGESQTTFRSVMQALAEPGLIRHVPNNLTPPAPLVPASAAILLALADYETPIWLDAASSAGGAADFLRFQTGAAIVAEMNRAAFAVMADHSKLDGFERFMQGTLEFPDRSTTVIIQVVSLAEGGPLHLTGPGIPGTRQLEIEPPIDGFVGMLMANQARFPLGVDVLLVAGNAVVGLPRTTRIAVEAD